ncbi:hypothetical protein THAOC_08873, partial [Thalassiosira oceanica]
APDHPKVLRVPVRVQQGVPRGRPVRLTDVHGGYQGVPAPKRLVERRGGVRLALPRRSRRPRRRPDRPLGRRDVRPGRGEQPEVRDPDARPGGEAGGRRRGPAPAELHPVAVAVGRGGRLARAEVRYRRGRPGGLEEYPRDERVSHCCSEVFRADGNSLLVKMSARSPRVPSSTNCCPPRVEKGADSHAPNASELSLLAAGFELFSRPDDTRRAADRPPSLDATSHERLAMLPNWCGDVAPEDED